jgi:hypothetical protein
MSPIYVPGKVVLSQTSYPDIRNGIVTNGLVLNLDAGQTASYPGTGTTWTDLSGNGNNGTLVNGPTYSSANSGSLVFDGTNDFVSTNYTPPNVNYTVSLFFKNTATASNQFNRGLFSTYLDSPAIYNGIYVGTTATNASFTALRFFCNNNRFINIPYSFLVNSYYQLTFAVSASLILTYVDSNLVLSDSNVGAATTHATVLNIARSRFDANYWQGEIPQFSVYNRALTAAEVQQNFNCLRMRYGI